MINSKLKGMGVALITPFKTDESIDFDALSRLIEHQVKNGTDYLVVCGSELCFRKITNSFRSGW